MSPKGLFGFCSGSEAHCKDGEELVFSSWRCEASVCGKDSCLEGIGRQLRHRDLDAAMVEASWSIRPWDQGSFGMVRRLQDALGNYGHVDLMESCELGQTVAVKQMPNSWVASSPHEFEAKNPDAAERPWRDLGFLWELNKMNFPYACQLLGIFRDEEKTYVVTSLATEGDLFAWRTQEPKPGPEREALMVPIVKQVFSAVKWLHDLGIAHRDLSLENILLTEGSDKTEQVKIIDFAMGTLSRKCRGEMRGKVVYRAPEMFCAEAAYDAFLADTFALGVVLFAMAARDYPWASTRRRTCKCFDYVERFGLRKFLEQRKVRKGNGEALAQVFSDAFTELLEGLLDMEPNRRLGLGENIPASEATASVWDSQWLKSAKGQPSTAEDETTGAVVSM